jgi:hypothetical protein
MSRAGRGNGGGRVLNIMTGLALAVALIQNLYLSRWLLTNILVPVSIGLAYLLFLGLRRRLTNASLALLLAAIAAAVWPWTTFLGMGHLGDYGQGLFLGFLAPFAVIAIGAMMCT